MDEELQSKLLEYLTALEAGIKQSGDFVVEQAPLVVQEFLAWEFWGSIICAVLALSVYAGLVLAFLLVRRAARALSDVDRVGVTVIGTIVLVFAAIPCFTIAGAEAKHAVKVKVAPRVVVLEKAAELIQKAK